MSKAKHGPPREVTDEWRRAVIDNLKKKKLSRADLARRLGVTRGAITQLLTTSKTSVLVDEIHRIVLAEQHDALDEDDRVVAKNLFRELDKEAADPEAVKSLLGKMTPAGREYVRVQVMDSARIAITDVHEKELGVIEAHQRLDEAMRDRDIAHDRGEHANRQMFLLIEAFRAITGSPKHR